MFKTENKEEAEKEIVQFITSQGVTADDIFTIQKGFFSINL